MDAMREDPDARGTRAQAESPPDPAFRYASVKAAGEEEAPQGITLPAEIISVKALIAAVEKFVDAEAIFCASRPKVLCYAMLCYAKLG
jgi:hypothetical protein